MIDYLGKCPVGGRIESPYIKLLVFIGLIFLIALWWVLFVNAPFSIVVNPN